jgi:hypothetical protein
VSAMNELSRLGHEVSAGQIQTWTTIKVRFEGHPQAGRPYSRINGLSQLLGGPQGYCRFRAASGRAR